MDNIMTAISQEHILKKIIKKNIIINKNILYKEAILEILKKYNNINIIIISEEIAGDIEFIQLIKKIKKINNNIKIIIILSNKKTKEKLIEINITDIYYNNLFSIHKLIKSLKSKNKENKSRIKEIKNRIKSKYKINIKNNDKQKKNIINIFGESEIDLKIVKSLIMKKLIIENKKIIIIDLKIKNKKGKKKRNKIIKKIKSYKKIYYLKTKKDYKIKEKKINNKIKKIININKILKNKNMLIKKIILKKIIKKYSKNNYYIIFNINYKNIKINKIKNKFINIIAVENNKKNLIKLFNNKNRKINIIILNYKKNNFSKYFYLLEMKKRFGKVKVI